MMMWWANHVLLAASIPAAANRKTPGQAHYHWRGAPTEGLKRFIRFRKESNRLTEVIRWRRDS